MSTESIKNEHITRPMQNSPQEVKADDNLLFNALKISNSDTDNSVNSEAGSQISGLEGYTFDDIDQNLSADDADKLFGQLADLVQELPAPDDINETDKIKNMPSQLLGQPAIGRAIVNPALEQNAIRLASGLATASYMVRNYGIGVFNQGQWTLFNNYLRTLHANMATIANNYGANVQPYASNTAYGGNAWYNGGNPWFNNLARCFANIMTGNPLNNNANGNAIAFDPNDLLLNYAGYNRYWASAGVNGMNPGIFGLA